MDMIVKFLRWNRAETERGCYGVILPILMVAASARIFLTLEESLVHKEGLLVDQYGRINTLCSSNQDVECSVPDSSNVEMLSSPKTS